MYVSVVVGEHPATGQPRSAVNIRKVTFDPLDPENLELLDACLEKAKLEMLGFIKEQASK